MAHFLNTIMRERKSFKEENDRKNGTINTTGVGKYLSH